MGEISIVGPGKTRGYPYPVCKKTAVYNITRRPNRTLCKGHKHTAVAELCYFI